jgi:hypothetical protein
MYLVRVTQESSPAFTMTTSRPREGIGVIVGAGADADGGRGPLWSPGGGVGPLTWLPLNMSVREEVVGSAAFPHATPGRCKHPFPATSPLPPLLG